jgi:hypothetical protein
MPLWSRLATPIFISLEQRTSKTLPLKAAGDGVVGERAEADESGRATRAAREWHWVIRFARQSFTAVKAVWGAPAQESVLTRAGTSKARA